MNELVKLPFEIQSIIFSFFTIEDLQIISLVSKSCFQFIADVSIKRFKLKVDNTNFPTLKRRRKLLRDYSSLKLLATRRTFKYAVPQKFYDLFSDIQHLEISFEDLWNHKNCSINFFAFLNQLPNIKSLKWDSIEEMPDITAQFIKQYCFTFNLDQLELFNIDDLNFLQLFPESNKLKKLLINCDCHLDAISYEKIFLEFLNRQTILTHLELSWMELDDGFFKDLPLQLSKLHLDYCSLKDHNMLCKFLINQKCMEALSFKECKGLNNKILQTICGLLTLKHLEIDLCNGFEVLNSEDLYFYKLANLKSLNISNHPSTSDDLFVNLFGGAENLKMKNLELQYVDFKMSELTRKFPNLSTLDLREIKLSNDDLNCIFTNLKFLYKLFLDLQCNDSTDDLRTTAQLTNLRHLTVSKSHSSLTDTFIDQLLKVSPNLKSLNFEFCNQFDYTWIVLTFKMLKYIKILKLSKMETNHEELKTGKLLETIEDLQSDDFECLILNFHLYNYAFNYLKGISYKVICE